MIKRGENMMLEHIYKYVIKKYKLMEKKIWK